MPPIVWKQLGDEAPKPEQICLVDRSPEEMPQVFIFVLSADSEEAFWVDPDGNEFAADEFDVWTPCPRKDI